MILAAAESGVLDETAIARTFLLNCHGVQVSNKDGCSGASLCTALAFWRTFI